MKKIYKKRGWARKAAYKLKWHTYEECRGGFRIRPMTAEEKTLSKRTATFNSAILDIFIPAIASEINRPSSMYSFIRKPR